MALYSLHSRKRRRGSKRHSEFFDILQNEYVIIGEKMVSSFLAWAIIAVMFGATMSGALLVPYIGGGEAAVFMGVAPATVAGDAASSDPAVLANDVEKLNTQVLNLNENLKRGVSGASRAEVAKALKQRKQALKALSKKNPQKVVELAFTNEVKNSLPADLQTDVEEQVNLEGELVVSHAHGLNFSGIQNEYFLLDKSTNEKVTLNIAGKKPKLEAAGSRVRVRGVKLDEEVAVSISGDSFGTLTAPLAVPAASTKKVAVILIRFTDGVPSAKTPDEIRTLTFTSPASTHKFYEEASFSKIGLSGNIRPDGDVYGRFTIPYPQSGCTTKYSDWAVAAKAEATKQGFNPSGYDAVIYEFSASSCWWWGLGQVGGPLPRQIWINTVGGYDPLRVVAHEFAHTLGLYYHANTSKCTKGGASVSFSDTCTAQEYGDPFDVLGGGRGKHLNGFHKSKLSWLDAANITNVSVSQQYTIAPLETSSTMPQVLRVPRTVGDSTNGYFYVDYRQPVGFDSTMYSGPAVNGVMIRYVDGVELEGRLLDMTPGDNKFTDAALPVGNTFTDPTTGTSIKLLSAGASLATLQVNVSSSAACTRANPSLTITPLNQWGSPGKSLTYSLIATNNDSSGCPASPFNTNFTWETDWNLAPYAFNFDLAPGASITKTFTLTPPASAASGSYRATAQVIRSGTSHVSPVVPFSYNIGVASNDVPTVSAGTNQSISLPSNASLVGTAGDDGFPNPPGRLTTYWSKVSGPGTVTFLNSTALSTSAAFSTPGTYVLNLTATDSALSASDSVTVNVAAVPGGGGDGDTGDDGEIIGTSYSDNFDRADAADLGADWVGRRGVFSIKGNKVQNGTNRTGNIALFTKLPNATSAGADFTSSENNGGPYFGVMLGYLDDKNYYLFYRQVGGSSRIKISKIVDGKENVLKNISLPNPKKGEPFRIGGKVEGSKLTLMLNREDKISVDDPSFKLGLSGLMVGYLKIPRVHSVDNFSASAD